MIASMPPWIRMIHHDSGKFPVLEQIVKHFHVYLTLADTQLLNMRFQVIEIHRMLSDLECISSQRIAITNTLKHDSFKLDKWLALRTHDCTMRGLRRNENVYLGLPFDYKRDIIICLQHPDILTVWLPGSRSLHVQHETKNIQRHDFKKRKSNICIRNF